MMRIVFLAETFSRNTGYIQNVLPKYLARLGADMHVVTEDLPPNFQINRFKETYDSFVSELSPGSEERIDGYTLHVLPHRRLLGYMRMTGMFQKLRELRPDVVQTGAAVGWIPLDAAIASRLLGFKLFTASNYTASVFPLAYRKNRLWEYPYLKALTTRAIPGRIVSVVSEKCYGATTDCADVAIRFFGVQGAKMDVCPLGVETDVFFPMRCDADRSHRAEVRARLGFRDDEIICIYTGRFSEEKNPLVMADAVEELAARGLPFRGLFVGDGVQADELRKRRHSVVHGFVRFQHLGEFFRACDIGVWPTQESMSLLDAAACGLPVVANHTLVARERIEGNGLTYRLNDVLDMTRVLERLQDAGERMKLGSAGARKMATLYSWEAIAKRRYEDYERALRSNGSAAGAP